MLNRIMKAFGYTQITKEPFEAQPQTAGPAGVTGTIHADGTITEPGNELFVEQAEPKSEPTADSEGLGLFSYAAVGQTFGHRDIAQWIVDRNEFVKHYSGSVYVAVGAIARKIAMQQAKVGVKVTDKAGTRVEEIDATHPLNSLFQEPNPVMTEFELWFSTVAWRLITGDSFLWKARNGLGVCSELWPMPSQWTFAIPDSQQYISGYRVRGVFGRTDVIIPARDMLHMKEPSIDWANNGRFYGFPQLAASASMVDMEEAMLKRLYHEFRNFAPPGLHYDTTEKLEETELKRIYAQVMAMHSAAEHSGKPIITHSGFKASDFNNNKSREMNYRDSIDVAMEYILAIFGVPKAIVGLVKDTNRANMQAAMLSFCENTINPLLVAIGQALTLSLGHEFDDRLVVWFDPCTVEDMEQMRKNIETAQKQGAVMPNEVRDVLLRKGSLKQGGDRGLVNKSNVPAPHGNDDNVPPTEEEKLEAAAQRQSAAADAAASRAAELASQQQNVNGKPPPTNGKAPKDKKTPEEQETDRVAAQKVFDDEDDLFDVDKSGSLVASGGGGERFFSLPIDRMRQSRLPSNGSTSISDAN